MNRLTDKRFTKSGFVAISSEERKKLYIPTLEEVYIKLAEYEDLEEQGRLIKLPCKVGDKVYEKDLEVLKILKKYFKVYYDDETENGLENGVFSGIDLDDIWAGGEDEDFNKIMRWLEK